VSSDERPGEIAEAAEEILTAEELAKPRSNIRRNLAILLVAVIVLDVLALLFVPPFPKGGTPGENCAYPICFINGTLEFPPPHPVIDLDPNSELGTGQLVVGFDPTISNTIITMWIVAAIVLVVMIGATRGMRDVPGRLQNLVEFAYESLQNFATSVGGPEAKRFVPFYAAFFLLILFSNWSGLVPPVGRIEELRAPTSDVNITIGLALVSFAYFEYQGFRANGVLGYLGKFFPLGEFRNGIGAGIIGLFVGLIELMLEFVKPITLSMRLFGNIYGGEVALGVMTALTLALIPVALFALELMLNFVQALIFSVLTLMFTLAAVESHADDHERGETNEPISTPVEDPGLRPSPAH
jgi:F-type H+-transporting ATPase subunit a